MSKLTAEQLAQRAIDVNILDTSQIQSIWSDLGTHSASIEDFAQALLRREFLTNYQLERLVQGQRTGFFCGPYKILYSVGAGTFARVFRAAHRDTNKLVAIKLLRSRFSNPSAEPNNPGIIELFRREGELGLSLQHQNIVPVHEVFSQNNIHYIVMDFVEGRNLREFYRIRRKFEPSEAAELIAGVVAGLAYAFQKGVTHRDLKMSNILVSSEGVPKLVDFGLAGLEEELNEDLGEGVNRRTIEYAGLERSTGVRKDDPRSDIFFVGCMLYQMVSGQPAMAETRDRGQLMSKTRYENIRPILELVPKLPLPLAMVINKAVEFDPERRYQNPGEMFTDLKVALKRIREGGEHATTAAKELHSEEGLDANGNPRKIMIVEADIKMQDLFRDLFKKNGYRVLVASDPQKALGRFYDDHRTADVVLFTTQIIGHPALEMFNKFGQEGATKALPAVLLLDERHRDWEAQAETTESRRIVHMPAKQRELREAVLCALNGGTT